MLVRTLEGRKIGEGNSAAGEMSWESIAGPRESTKGNAAETPARFAVSVALRNSEFHSSMGLIPK